MVRKILDNKIIRYFFSAGLATLVDISVYFVAFNYIYQKQDINFFSIAVLSAPTASLMLSYTCGLITNFFITKYLVFKESDLKGIHQLLRYIMVALLILILNYFFMSFLIKVLNWFPTIARIVSALSIGMLSFVIHKFYSFKVSNK